MRRRRPLPRRAAAGALVAVAAVALGATAFARIQPTNAHVYRAEEAVLPEITFHGHEVTIRHVRNFTFRPDGRSVPGYYDRTYDLDALVRVWFVLSPFAKLWRGPAHAFVSFEFADSQFVAISVEARKEPGEEYSPLLGMLKRYELMYVVADERDVIGLRALVWGDPVYVYPGRATPAQVRALFVHMLRRAQRLASHPEFYNTLTNNCTTNIEDAVNAVAPGRARRGLEGILPGYADEAALEDGLLDTDLPLEAARRRYRVNERATAAATAPDFSLRIRRPAAAPSPS
ncbi:MAG: DUF4105 domain-containing protein [Gemmatimonadetes bacterium]|nr:DUF4105 domain-containing protein [Gemmatimonadota bacterium]